MPSRRRSGRSRRVGPAPLVAPPAAPLVAPTAARLGSWGVAATVFLTLAGILPPAALAASPWILRLLGPRPAAVALIAALVLAAGAVAAVAARLGPARVSQSVRARADNELEHAVWRVFVLALLLCCAVALAATGAASEAAPCLVVAALGLVVGWGGLLLAILGRGPSAPRLYAAIVVDCGVLSAFLHFGGAAAAAGYPVYLAAIFYAGLRLGPGALAAAAAAALAGFAAVVATTPFWQHQAGLAAGLIAILAASPGGLAMLVRALARSRADAAAASAAQARFVALIGRGLRTPVDAMLRAAAADAEPAPALPPRALLAQISEVLDLAAIEAGDFTPPIVPFDLHAIANDTVALLRGAAGERGIALALRLDPHLPYRLRGWPQQLAQVFTSLLVAAIATCAGGAIRIEFTAGRGDGDIVPLRLAVRRPGDPAAAADEDALGLGVARRLVELMGGRLDAVGEPGRGDGWMLALPLAIDAVSPQAPLDLARRPVLMATEDGRFAGELAEPLDGWNADVRWIGGFDDALVYVERFEPEQNPVLIVDGRRRAIPALSFVHRAALACTVPPFILFVADAAQIGSLAELADGELTGLLPAPLDDRVLENALHALPLSPPAPVPIAVPPADERGETAPDEFAGADGRVTPIAAHPRFAASAAAVVDARVVAALRALGGGSEFLGEVIDSFHADSRQIMARIAAAAGAADAAGFARAVHALRRCATTLGGTRLGELALVLRDVTAPELEQQGTAIVQRLAAELAGLDAALLEFLPVRGEMRG